MSMLFTYPGNACILKDFENDTYVGIAYCFKAKGCPVFATFSARVSEDRPFEFCLLWITESLEQGLKQKNREPTTAICYRDANRAIITGDGQHYAIGVSGGSLHYACPEEGLVTDDDLSRELSKKMRCTDRC